MKIPVDHVRVSAKSRDILIKIKRRTGLEHWNEICRIAICRSLANSTPPNKENRSGDSAIDMEWKTFAGEFSAELSSVIHLRAKRENVDINSKDALADFVRTHIERGIASLQNIKTMSDLIK